MKCLAAPVMYSNKLHEVKVEYGMYFMEFIDLSLGVILYDTKGWRKVRLQRLYDHNRDYLVDGVEKYRADNMKVKRKHKGVVKADESELMYDALASTQHAIDRELKAAGFKCEWDKLTPADTFSESWHSEYEKNRHALRYDWYARNGKPAASAYIAGALMYFRENYGYGGARLTELYETSAADIRWYLQAFLRSENSRDNEIREKFKEYRALLELAGIEFVKISDGGMLFEDVIDHREEKPTEIMKAGNTEEYEKILDDLKKRYVGGRL